MNMYVLPFIMISMFMSCSMFKPACPSIPTYPGAVAQAYTEYQGITRTTTYIVQAPAQDIVHYYLKQFEAGGWVLRSQDVQMMNLSYITTSSQPPFNVSTIIDQETGGRTTFRVSITIHGPFAWRNWRTTLKP